MEFRKPEWSLYFRDIDIYLTKLSNDDIALIVSTLEKSRFSTTFAFHTSKGKWLQLGESINEIPKLQANDPMKFPKLPAKALGPYLQPTEQPPAGQARATLPPTAPPVTNPYARKDLPPEPKPDVKSETQIPLSASLPARQLKKPVIVPPTAPPLKLDQTEIPAPQPVEKKQTAPLELKRVPSPKSHNPSDLRSHGFENDDDEPFLFSSPTIITLAPEMSSNDENTQRDIESSASGRMSESAQFLPPSMIDDEKTVVDVDPIENSSDESSIAAVATTTTDKNQQDSKSGRERRSKPRVPLLPVPAELELRFIALNGDTTWTTPVTHLGFPDILLAEDLPPEFPSISDCYLDTSDRLFELTFQIGQPVDSHRPRAKLYFLPSNHYELLNEWVSIYATKASDDDSNRS